MPEAKRGSVVISRAGRDSGKIFVVAGLENGKFLFLADGKERRIEKSKKKNVCHVSVMRPVLDESVFTSNKVLRKAISGLKEEYNVKAGYDRD